jgi:hypothetical protein
MSRGSNGVWSAPVNGWNPAVAGATVKSADWNSLLADLTTAMNLPYPSFQLGGFVDGVNLNTTNTDTPITISSSTPNYQIRLVAVSNASTSLTTVTAGVFTATGGGGTTVSANQALSGITSTTANSASNGIALTLANPGTWFNSATLQFRTGTAQGAAATANVYIFIAPLP